MLSSSVGPNLRPSRIVTALLIGKSSRTLTEFLATRGSSERGSTIPMVTPSARQIVTRVRPFPGASINFVADSTGTTFLDAVGEWDASPDPFTSSRRPLLGKVIIDGPTSRSWRTVSALRGPAWRDFLKRSFRSKLALLRLAWTLILWTRYSLSRSRSPSSSSMTRASAFSILFSRISFSRRDCVSWTQMLALRVS